MLHDEVLKHNQEKDWGEASILYCLRNEWVLTYEEKHGGEKHNKCVSEYLDKEVLEDKRFALLIGWLLHYFKIWVKNVLNATFILKLEIIVLTIIWPFQE
jgi:hypothetical protein